MTIAETTAPFERTVPFAELDARTQRDRRRSRRRRSTTPSSRRGTWRSRCRPVAVLAAETAQDVVEAVRFAARARPAGDPAGHRPRPDGRARSRELLVTTKRLDEVVVHPEGWARVGAGVKWLRVVEAAAPYGLAPLSGSITDVGIVGYTTGGGLGPMARTYGLAIDKVRAIEVVTGDGVLRRVTPTEHPELFFALRGGKGMLGIVTAIEFDLVAPAEVLRRLVVVRRRGRGDRHRAVAGLVRRPARGGTTSFALFQLPEMPGVPPTARRPAHAVGALRVDRRRRGGERVASPRCVGRLR